MMRAHGGMYPCVQFHIPGCRVQNRRYACPRRGYVSWSRVSGRTKPKFPRGWNAKRVQDVITYYDQQTEDEELAEYEAGMSMEGFAVMLVPSKLVPEVRRLIGHRRGA
jgi:hypothetical protein